MSIFFIFLLGLFIGSFLNVLIDRIPNNKTILGRSSCDHCHKTLQWYDLIPIISFVYLKGRCRFCKAELSYYYPFMEVLTGIMFVITYLFTIYQIPFTNSSVYYLFTIIYSLAIVSSFIVIFFADLKYGIIPDEILAFMVIVFILFLAFSNLPYTNYHIPFENGQLSIVNDQLSIIFNHIASAIGAFLFFLLIFMLTRGRGMGFGDVKLAGILGLLLGFPGVALAIYIAFLTGGLAGIILILWKKKKMKSAVPFGPFLISGAFLSFFFSPVIIPKLLQFF